MSKLLQDKRKTRGLRMSALIGEAEEQDQSFWGSEIWKEEESDDSFSEEEIKPDEFDSDFNDSEDDDDENDSDDEPRKESRKVSCYLLFIFYVSIILFMIIYCYLLLLNNSKQIPTTNTVNRVI
jgi:hypothetical protein